MWILWLRSSVHDEPWYNQAQLGPMNGLNAYERQNLHDRSRGNDSTERGRDCRPACQAPGRRDRQDVPQRVCTWLAIRTRDYWVFPQSSWAAAAVGGTDEPDDPELCGEAGGLCYP